MVTFPNFTERSADLLVYIYKKSLGKTRISGEILVYTGLLNKDFMSQNEKDISRMKNRYCTVSSKEG